MSADVDAPGGLPRALAKRGYEEALWARIQVQRWVEGARRGAGPRPRPEAPVATGVLGSTAEWRRSVTEGRRLRLPLHPDRQKNWDALVALSVVLNATEPHELVVDAGSARYSPLLPWLRLYGYEHLLGLNLEFGDPVRHQGVEFRYGDVTATGLETGSVGAISCLSVIEHGVPVPAFLRESARVLRPGGVLVVSTDFDSSPPDTTGKVAYGQQVHIFSPGEISELVATAAGEGLALRGTLDTHHDERPVHWKRQDLDYTCIALTFDRVGTP